ncbi:hypothetical protein IW262DRAFT_1229707, partial [Armillaria fumosa]
DADKLIELTVDRFKLNYHQAMAFKIMAHTYLSRKEPYSMRLFLMGLGGTGKTHVIKALISVMEQCRDGHTIQFLAPTRSAAAINDGMTVHKAFGLN